MVSGEKAPERCRDAHNMVSPLGGSEAADDPLSLSVGCLGNIVESVFRAELLLKFACGRALLSGKIVGMSLGFTKPGKSERS